jgi:hypothetical protein
MPAFLAAAQMTRYKMEGTWPEPGPDQRLGILEVPLCQFTRTDTGKHTRTGYRTLYSLNAGEYARPTRSEVS